MPEITFSVSKNGKEMSAEEVALLPEGPKDELHTAIYKHYEENAPESARDFQVDIEDYGLYINFTSEDVSFEIPDLTVTIGKNTYTVSFESYSANNNNNNNNNNGNMNGGKRRRRRSTRRRRNTRRHRKTRRATHRRR